MPRISLAVSVTAVLKVVIIEFMSVSSLFMMVRGTNFPPIIVWKVSNTYIGIFQLFEIKLESCVFWLADSFSDEDGKLSSASRGHFQCLLLENLVFWQCSLLIGSASSLDVINLAVVLSIWAMPGPSFGGFVTTKSVGHDKIARGGKLQESESSLICVIIAGGSANALPLFISIVVGI